MYMSGNIGLSAENWLNTSKPLHGILAQLQDFITNSTSGWDSSKQGEDKPFYAVNLFVDMVRRLQVH
jgi:hypothetical protein